jgi:chorismate mutase
MEADELIRLITERIGYLKSVADAKSAEDQR